MVWKICISGVLFANLLAPAFGAEPSVKESSPQRVLATCQQGALAVSTYIDALSTVAIISNLRVTKSEIVFSKPPHHRLKYRVAWQRQGHGAADFEIVFDAIDDDMPICHVIDVHRMSSPS